MQGLLFYCKFIFLKQQGRYVLWVWERERERDTEERGINILWEFPADPSCGIQNFTDAVTLHVAGQQVGVIQQSGHLGNSKNPNGFDSNSNIQHLRGNKVAMPCALQSGQLHQDTDVPVKQIWRGAVVYNVTDCEYNRSKLTKLWVKPVSAGVKWNWPFKVSDVLVVALATDVNDLGEQFVSVGCSFCFVHMQHQLLYNLHQVLFRYLESANISASSLRFQ